MSILTATIVFAGALAVVTEEPRTSVAVFLRVADVEERESVDKETEKRLKASRNDAKKARKDLEKQLKKAHGKKKEKWPAGWRATFCKCRFVY